MSDSDGTQSDTSGSENTEQGAGQRSDDKSKLDDIMEEVGSVIMVSGAGTFRLPDKATMIEELTNDDGVIKEEEFRYLVKKVSDVAISDIEQSPQTTTDT